MNTGEQQLLSIKQKLQMGQPELTCEELVEKEPATLAKAITHPLFNNTEKAIMIDALSTVWDEEPDLVRSTLKSLVEHPSATIQDRAFRGLMPFFYAQDQDVTAFLRNKPLSTYHQSVQSTVTRFIRGTHEQ